MTSSLLGVVSSAAGAGLPEPRDRAGWGCCGIMLAPRLAMGRSSERGEEVVGGVIRRLSLMPETNVDRVDVTSWEIVRVETRGAAAKTWVREPGGSSTRFESDWLFKPTTVQANGIRQTGDWTECVGSALALALGIPAAASRLAVQDGVTGVIVQNVRASGYDMVTGRLAMLHEIGVATRDSDRDKTASRGHSVDNILGTLAAYGPPPGWASWSTSSATDVMVSYFVLDALIGNGDRHEQNWSVLRARSSADGLPDSLAPTYDLEASLGFQLSDEQRTARLRDKRAMEDFARKGRARRFDGDRATSLVDLAARAFGSCTPAGIEQIISLVERIATFDYTAFVGDIAGVSEVARTFAINVLEVNGRRICDVDWHAHGASH